MKRFVNYLLILPLLFGAASCVKDHFDYSGKDNGEKNVTLKVSMPYTIPQGAGMRSMGATQENTIETLDVLAFKIEGGVETFQYWSEAKQAAGNTEGAMSQSFSVRLRVKDYQQCFVVITNARDKVTDLITQADWGNAEKEAMLKQLEVSLNGSDRWNAISASNYAAIPMWGQSEPKTVAGTTTSIGTVSLLRMIAKVDVQLDTDYDPALASVFKLKSVHVYNTNTSGRIVPKTGTEYVGTDMVAKKASLPASVISVTGPTGYSDFTSPGELDKAMRGAIYLFETEARNAGNFLEETCIVVGGLYGTDTQESYYRLDFFAPDGTTHLDILRNHKYTFNIVDVKGRGYPTVDEAYRVKSFNMSVNILVWNESEIKDIVFDNQYMLGVNRNPVILKDEEHNIICDDNILKIITDYPGGWTATVWGDKAGTIPVPNDAVTGAPWMSISPASGAGGVQPDEVHIIATTNPTTNPRTAYVHIQAGRLTYVVTVIQNTLPGTVSVSPEDFLLPHTIPAGANYPITVSCKLFDGVTDDPGAAWTLALWNQDPEWVRLATSPNTTFANATGILSGTGPATVYLIPTNNTDVQARSTSINVYLSSSTTEVTRIIQWGKHNIGIITDNEGGGTPVSARTYVGAFWKANQKGERIIRIEADGNVGAWTATVMWADERWSNRDGVLLSTEMIDNQSLASRGVSFTSDMTPEDAELHPITGYVTTVSGNVYNGYIMFRIGLRSHYTPTLEHPARYAVVLLEYTYSGATRYQKIFLRQGGDADYLMLPTDPINTGGVSGRLAAVMFSPYNLTGTNLDAVANPGVFTDYPSKAGAIFQWASGTNPDRRRYAWNAHSLNQPTGWSPLAGVYNLWNVATIDNETCPVGYHRPSDGSTSSYESSATVANSEMRQSLFNKPGAGVNYVSEVSNSLWGYYADGYFDRRRPMDTSGSILKAAVAHGNREVAYIGRLFFNPLENSDRYNASIFFPAAGQRFHDTGMLTATGSYGYYWSASANSNTNALTLRLADGAYGAGAWLANGAFSMSIRCVKDVHR